MTTTEYQILGMNEVRFADLLVETCTDLGGEDVHHGLNAARPKIKEMN
jgi:hypothetical protein